MAQGQHHPQRAVRVKPLPRLLAFTDDRVASLDDLGERAAAIAAVGSAVALVARLPGGSTDQLASLALRFVALARPPMASVFVMDRIDVAMATGADGVVVDSACVLQIPMPGSARTYGSYALVHSVEEAQAAVDDGTSGLVLGTIWPTASHPGREPAGPGLIDRVARCGVPVWAIGGVTAERAREAREAGAWGVASISAVWDAIHPNQAALELLDAWRSTEE